MKKAAFITIHGMGETPEDYSLEIVKELKSRLRLQAEDLHIGNVYYQKILQDNENFVWGKVKKRVKWDELRKFLLFGIADAAGLENGKEKKNSVYSQAQVFLAKQLLAARNAMGGDGPVFILTHSLGGQVASCYFWDAMQSHPTAGIWQDVGNLARVVNNGTALSDQELDFLRGKTSLKFLYTTGCNIPIFVAAHLSEDILPIAPNSTFKWHNFYDKDDVLGWPLAELSDEYSHAVEDHVVNAASGIMGWLLKSWNPMSHTQYWGDDEILDHIEESLRGLLE